MFIFKVDGRKLVQGFGVVIVAAETEERALALCEGDVEQPQCRKIGIATSDIKEGVLVRQRNRPMVG